jgi:hypothetical protein
MWRDIMKKTISLDQTIFDLITNYPEAKAVMVELGFENITNPLMLKTVGKVMTLRKGAQMKHIDLQKIIDTFLQYSFHVEEKI